MISTALGPAPSRSERTSDPSTETHERASTERRKIRGLRYASGVCFRHPDGGVPFGFPLKPQQWGALKKDLPILCLCFVLSVRAWLLIFSQHLQDVNGA